jgi:hypothetical protein
MLLDLAKKRQYLILAATLLLLLLAACGGGASDSGDDHADHDHAEGEMDHAEEAADDGAPRVYFVGLENHATIPSLINLQFAAENFVIEPVGDGAINEGAGHYHIAIDGECLEPGIVIPTADPWIHFGDGSDSIEIELSPGEHYLCLQIGDGEHRTLDEPGLSQYIMVHVEEEAAE